jgi:DNA-directed RNA polymerase specialized sigma24 family protein
MSTNYNAAVSLTRSGVHLSPARYQPPQLNVAQPAQPQEIASEGYLNISAFERFLFWLGPDPETAGRKYESIRGRLIAMFKARGCAFAEDLADATFERVVRKLPDLITEFTGDPAGYFYGVAKKIYLEYQREITIAHRRSRHWPAASTDNPDLENMLKQLDEALSTIPKSDCELILRYYTGSGKNKITHRRHLAEQFGLRPSSLRLRVFRIRREIKSYMSRSGAEFPSRRTNKLSPFTCERMKLSGDR